jgi:integrase
MKIYIKLDKRVAGETPLGFPIVIYCSQNYKNKVIRTGFYAKNKEWNDKLGSVKVLHPDFYLINDQIDFINCRIKLLIRKTITENFSINNVADFIYKKSYNTFYDAVIDLVNDKTSTKHSAIEAFNNFYPGVDFSQINKEMVNGFIAKMLKKGNKPGGVDSYIRSLRALFNVLSEEPNPFTKYKIDIPSKTNIVASENDIRTLKNANLEAIEAIGGANNYRNYWLLMFYLGGIDPEVLTKLRYDLHVVDGRIQFNRDKGQSKVACNNIIPEAAFEILKQYDCQPYLVPIYQSSNYKSFMGNFNRRFKELCVTLNLSAKLRPKTPRYTFINRAQQLLVDERVTAQIVGHKRKSTTSLYTNDFPLQVQDNAHLKIITFN